MPPCWDVYVRLRRLNPATVRKFLTRYLPDYLEPERWLGEDPGAVVQLERGLAGAARGFALYAWCAEGDYCSVIVALPHDGGAVLGLSVDMALGEPKASGVSEELLTKLLDETGAYEGFVVVEEPPPLRAEDWQRAISQPTVHSLHRST
jgi:hypothetical protein